MSHIPDPAPLPPSQKLMKLAVAGAALLVVAGGAAFYFASKNLKSGTADGAIVVTIKDGACDPNIITVRGTLDLQDRQQFGPRPRMGNS